MVLLKTPCVLKVKPRKREDAKGFRNNRILLRVKNLPISKAAAWWGEAGRGRERYARGNVYLSPA